MKHLKRFNENLDKTIRITGCKKNTLWYKPLVGQTVGYKWIYGTDHPTDKYITQGLKLGDAYITNDELTEEQVRLILEHNPNTEEEGDDIEGYISKEDYEIV